MRDKRQVLVAVAFLVLLGLFSFGCTRDDTETVDRGDGPTTATWTLESGYQMPQSVPADATQADWNEMGWQTFVALNWPAAWADWPSAGAEGLPGEPDTGKSIIDPLGAYAAVWQTYLSPDQVFLANGASPGSWADPTNQVAQQLDPATGRLLPVLGGFSKGSTSAGGEFNEATNNPLIDQNSNYVNYEIRMNESEFTYMSDNNFYDAAAQEAVTADGGTVPTMPKTGQEGDDDLPVWAQQGALEIKASWRILEAGDVPERYFTVEAFRELPSGEVDGPFIFGLVGMHILRLTPTSGSTWYWATFEQVDNVRIDAGAPSGLTPSFNPGTSAPYPNYPKGWEYNGQDTNPPAKITTDLPPSNPVDTSFIDNAIQADMPALNEAYQELLAGTPWQYYQMIGAQNPWVDGPSTPVPPFGGEANTGQLVNTTMETFSQGTAASPVSCLSCHAGAHPQGAETKNGLPAQSGNQIFSFLFGNAESSAGASG